MVSICPHCVRTIGTDWQEFGATFEIEHHSELLARHAAQPAGATAATGETVVYHDPCYLGRYRGRLRRAARGDRRARREVVDPPRARERSFCCGAGGGLMFLGEEKGKRVNVERAEELVATGARGDRHGLPVLPDDVPRRARHGRPAAAELLDIAQIAAASLGGPPPAARSYGLRGRAPPSRNSTR